VGIIVVEASEESESSSRGNTVLLRRIMKLSACGDNALHAEKIRHKLEADGSRESSECWTAFKANT
jgi:hypothetical protein